MGTSLVPEAVLLQTILSICSLRSCADVPYSARMFLSRTMIAKIIITNLMFSTDSACRVFDRVNDKRTRRIHDFVVESNSRVKLLRGGLKFARMLEHIRQEKAETVTSSTGDIRIDTEPSKKSITLASKDELNDYSQKLVKRLQKYGVEYGDDSTRRKIEKSNTDFNSRNKQRANHDEWLDNKQYQPYLHLQNIKQFDRPVTDHEIWQKSKEKFAHIKNLDMKDLLTRSEVDATRKVNQHHIELKLKEIQNLKMEIFFQNLASKPIDHGSQRSSVHNKASHTDLRFGASRSSLNAISSFANLGSKEELSKPYMQQHKNENSCQSLRRLDSQNRDQKTPTKSKLRIETSFGKLKKKPELTEETAATKLKENSLKELFSVRSMDARPTKYAMKVNSSKGFIIRDIELDKQIHTLISSMNSKKSDDQLIYDFIRYPDKSATIGYF